VLGVDACVWMHHFPYWYAEDVVKRGDFSRLAAHVKQRAKRVSRREIRLMLVFDGVRIPPRRVRTKRIGVPFQ
jgi:hypothetical protein